MQVTTPNGKKKLWLWKRSREVLEGVKLGEWCSYIIIPKDKRNKKKLNQTWHQNRYTRKKIGKSIVYEKCIANKVYY